MNTSDEVLVPDWVLRTLWDEFEEGAAKNSLSEEEMKEHVRRWDEQAEHDRQGSHRAVCYLKHIEYFGKNHRWPDRDMCPECGNKYYPWERPNDCICECPYKENENGQV